MSAPPYLYPLSSSGEDGEAVAWPLGGVTTVAFRQSNGVAQGRQPLVRASTTPWQLLPPFFLYLRAKEPALHHHLSSHYQGWHRSWTLHRLPGLHRWEHRQQEASIPSKLCYRLLAGDTLSSSASPPHKTNATYASPNSGRETPPPPPPWASPWLWSYDAHGSLSRHHLLCWDGLPPPLASTCCPYLRSSSGF